jgi:hypothetical protein
MKNSRNVLASLALILAASPAFARLADGPNYRQLDQMETRKAAVLIEIEGPLSCYQSESNDGQACRLSLADTKTGKVFEIRQNDQAMRLYMKGSRSVTLQGRLNASNQVEASRISVR